MTHATRYSPLSIALHWLMLLLIAAVYALIELRGEFPRGSPTRELMKSLHFSLGLVVFGLLWLRLLARALGPTPPVQPPLPAWQAGSARLVHLLLYAFMLAMPVLGWLTLSAAGEPVRLFGLGLPALLGADDALADRFEDLHEAVGTAGYVLIGLHAAAALFHHYVRRDSTLRRILPGKR